MAKPNSEAMIDADVDVAQVATPKQLATVVNAARQLKKLQNQGKEIEEELKAINKQIEFLEVETLPKAMGDANMDVTPLGKGWSVEINKIVSASIPAPDSKAENAVERNKLGIEYMKTLAPDLIDNIIVIRFPVGEEKFFNKVIGDIKKRKKELDYTTKSTIHSGRLSAFVRRQDEAGKSVDEIALNVHRIKRAKLVAPKAKKPLV